MSSKVVVGVIIGVVALVGIVVFFMNSDDETNQQNSSETSQQATDTSTDPDQPNSDTESPSDNQVSITYTDDGFDPSEIGPVPVGTTVTFVNESNGEMWPASDVHPTHEILSEFDAQEGIQPGGSYSYTFNEAGSWDFHDHLNSTQTGTVIVEE